MVVRFSDNLWPLNTAKKTSTFGSSVKSLSDWNEGGGCKGAEKARQIFDLHLSTTADKEVLFVLISSFTLLISCFFEGQYGQ